MSKILTLDGDIERRIEYAKGVASKISTGHYETYDECVLVLKWYICQHSSKSIWDDYFERLTLEQLIVEYELIRLSNRTPEEVSKEVITQNKEEIEDLFDDWMEEPKTKVSDWQKVNESDIKGSDEEFDKQAEKFMQTGQFLENDDA